MRLATTDLFFLHGSGDERLDYSPFRAWHFGARLDGALLAHALSLVARRYAFVHARVARRPDGCSIEPIEPAAMACTIDTRQMPRLDLDAAVTAAVNDRFDPFTLPLLKFHLFLCAHDEGCILVVRYHHVLCDGESLHRVLEALFLVYRSPNPEAQAHALPPLVRSDLPQLAAELDVLAMRFGAVTARLLPFFGMARLVQKLLARKHLGPFNVHSDVRDPISVRTICLAGGDGSPIWRTKKALDVSETAVVVYLLAKAVADIGAFGRRPARIWIPVSLSPDRKHGLVGNFLTSMQILVDTTRRTEEAIVRVSRQIQRRRRSPFDLGLTLLLERMVRTEASVKALIPKSDRGSHIQFGKNFCFFASRGWTDEFQVRTFVSGVPPRAYRQAAIRASHSGSSINVTLCCNANRLEHDLVDRFMQRVGVHAQALDDLAIGMRQAA